MSRQPEQSQVLPVSGKSGFVALVGRPNVGKSTLMNHLVGQKIAITSRKPQTTRNRIRTVYTETRGQIVFLDTPGMHKARNKLGEYMMTAAEGSLQEADVVLWLVEPDPYVGPGDQRIAELLRQAGRPTLLVVNKCDRVKKEVVQQALASYQKLGSFCETLAVSALQGRNLDALVDALFALLPEGQPFFPEDMVTDQPIREIAAEIIREKALRNLGEEIPHGIAVVIERMEQREGTSLADVEATLICEKDSHKGIIIGKQGSRLKKIGSEARPEIENLLEQKVHLRLWVKVRKNWRESDLLLKNYGYDKKTVR